MQGRCDKKGCQRVGIYHASVDLYPPGGQYEGAPAQLLFPSILFCEQHAKTLTWQDLIEPEPIAKVFQGLGRVAPDFSRSQVQLHLEVAQNEQPA